MLLDKCVRSPFIKEGRLSASWPAAFCNESSTRTTSTTCSHRPPNASTPTNCCSPLSVDLMTRVVIGQEPSVHAAYRKLEDQLPVSDQLRLQQTPARRTGRVSAALVRDSARTHRTRHPAALRASLPPLLPGYRVKFLDGNHLAATEHRLRGITLDVGSPFAGPRPGGPRPRTHT